MNKILIIANGIIGDDPSPSGGDVRFLMLAREWFKKGYEIHILSSSGCQRLIDQFGFEAKLHVLEWNDKTKIRRISFVWRAISSLLFLPKSLKNFEGIVYSANDSMFDVLPAWRLKLANRKKIKWSAIVHWIPPFPPWKRRQSSIINSILFYINVVLSVLIARFFADYLLPVSYSTSIQLKNYGVPINKTYSVKCGVDFNQIRTSAKKRTAKTYDAVFMKRIQGVKGAFDLVEIWKKVVEKRPDAVLAIIGDEGEDSVILRKKLDDAGISANIDFLGYIYDVDQKFEILNKSKLFILPSYEENWAISLGEAMCTGLPCIAYGLPELKQVWGNYVEWIEIGNKSDFASRIITYLSDYLLCESRVQPGIDFTSNLDWSILAQEELAIMDKK